MTSSGAGASSIVRHAERSVAANAAASGPCPATSPISRLTSSLAVGVTR